MHRTLVAFLLSAAALPALAQDVPAANEASAAASQPAEQPAAAADKAAAAETRQEVQVPPGFQTKKRGALTVYCTKDATVGTRFKSERCYSEDQLREYIAQREEQKQSIDRIRNTCGGGSACATQ